MRIIKENGKCKAEFGDARKAMALLEQVTWENNTPYLPTLDYDALMEMWTVSWYENEK